MTPLYYKHSGKFTLAGVALGLAGGIVAGLVLAFVYAYIISYLPFVYINALCTIGYSIVLGLAVGAILKWGKVRSTAITVVVALVVAVISLYFSWAVWLSVFLSRAEITSVGVFEVAQQPAELWDAIGRINEVGAWKIRNLVVSGGFLWFIWAIEALIVLGGTVFMAMATATATPFCEACQSWCHETDGLMVLRDTPADELKRRIEVKDFAYLKSLGPKADAERDWVKVKICHCPNCGQTNTLSVKREQLTINKKGESTTKSTAVVDNLLLNKDDVSRLRQIGQEVSAMPKPAAPAA